MKPGTGKAFTSAFLTLALSVFTSADPELPVVFSYVMIGLSLMSLVGALLMLTPMNRAGAIIVIVFSIPFIPLGLIGVLGGRNCLDHLKRESFEQAVA